MSDPNVIAVVAAYHPGAELDHNIDVLLEQVAGVIVVDDGSHVARRLLRTRAGLDIVDLDQNRGIATALNVGVQEAMNRYASQWILTMDQDSRLGRDYVQRALTTAREAAAAGIRIACVSAEFHNGRRIRMRGTRAGFSLLFDAMTSGSLIPRQVLEKTGGFEEALVIDAVDTEFNLRTWSSGLVQLAGAGCNLGHELGERRPLRVLGWQPRVRGHLLEIYYHSPLRTYYMVRNNLTIWRRWHRRFPLWCLRRAGMEAEGLIVALVYGPQRGRHLVAMIAGYRDGLRGRLGTIPNGLAIRLRTRVRPSTG